MYGFSGNIKCKVERGMKGQELVNQAVMEWESVVNRVAKCELGERITRLRTELMQDGKCI